MGGWLIRTLIQSVSHHLRNNLQSIYKLSLRKYLHISLITPYIIVFSQENNQLLDIKYLSLGLKSQDVGKVSVKASFEWMYVITPCAGGVSTSFWHKYGRGRFRKIEAMHRTQTFRDPHDPHLFAMEIISGKNYGSVCKPETALRVWDEHDMEVIPCSAR